MTACSVHGAPALTKNQTRSPALFLQLLDERFYDGTKFHEVIDGTNTRGMKVVQGAEGDLILDLSFRFCPEPVLPSHRISQDNPNRRLASAACRRDRGEPTNEREVGGEFHRR